MSDICVEFDHQRFKDQFEADCKRIVDDIQEKFIDLGVDNHSAYADNIHDRQTKLKEVLGKIPFEFKTQCLDLPQTSSASTDQFGLDKDQMDELSTTDATMGREIDRIFDIMEDTYGFD